MNIIQSFLNVIKDKKNQEIVAGVTDTLTVLPITSTALKIQEKYEETKKVSDQRDARYFVNMLKESAIKTQLLERIGAN